MVHLNVNGEARDLDVDPDTPLLYVPPDSLQLRRPRFGCGLDQCGAGSVLVDEQVVRSCVTIASDLQGKSITTLEGLGSPEHPHPVQAAFIAEAAAQC